jgi:hypothetical protein
MKELASLSANAFGVTKVSPPNAMLGRVDKHMKTMNNSLDMNASFPPTLFMCMHRACQGPVDSWLRGRLEWDAVPHSSP